MPYIIVVHLPSSLGGPRPLGAPRQNAFPLSLRDEVTPLSTAGILRRYLLPAPQGTS
jgi:hypothetical protein